MLQKTRWGILLEILNLVVLYGQWIVAVRGSLNRLIGVTTSAVGLAMVILALTLWTAVAPLVFRARGQVMTMPEVLVTEGPYRCTRHPLYMGHVVFISAGVLVSGALDLFLVTPLLWIIAPIASRYEEHTRLRPRFSCRFGDGFYRRSSTWESLSDCK